MAATTRYAAAISALSILSGVSANLEYPKCIPTTTTVYTTITVPDGGKASAVVKPSSVVAAPQVPYQYTPAPSWSVPGVSFPTYSPDHPNPNGPYYNPHNYLPEPINFPGLPTKGAVSPVQPSVRPYPEGGYNAGAYDAPHWCKKGTDLTPALPQKDTNGGSQWGLIDCPRLPPYLPPDGGYVSPSVTSKGSSSKPTGSWGSASSTAGGVSSSSGSAPYPSPSHSGNGSHSGNSTRTSSSWVSSITSSLPPFSDTCSTNSTTAICAKMPETGVTRKYNFKVAYGTISPDGVTKNAILINGQFPGPLIEANWGDWIEVHVENDLPENAGDHGEPTALHWHGMLMHETPFWDGVPSVQQCPITPQKSLTYRFRADQFGSSWYHSHYSAQYAAGAYGPIVIHGPTHQCYDEDIGPIIVSDHYHKDFYTLIRSGFNNTTPLSNNILINGKNNYPCGNTTLQCTPNAGVSKFRFTPGKKYRLRLINTSGDAFIKYTIDGHNFTVFANDFKPVVPYTASVINLAVGQRSDVVVEAIGTAGSSYWMRAEAGNSPSRNGCSFTDGVSTQAVAAIYYDGADENSVPTTVTGLTVAQRQACGNDALTLTSAFCPQPLASEAETQVVNLDFHFINNGTHFVWTVNNQTFRANMNVNLLDNVISGNTTYEPEWNVFTMDPTKKAVRLVMRNFWPAAHPMHLHGHDFNVLATGFGAWDGTVVNPARTVVRDTFGIPPFRANATLPGGGTPAYSVIQYTQDNPGVWPFHCHIAWHVSQGLYINILEKPAEITYQIPRSIKAGCVEYNEWTKTNIVNQIDSGL